jgi:hypothetical protein
MTQFWTEGFPYEYPGSDEMQPIAIWAELQALWTQYGPLALSIIQQILAATSNHQAATGQPVTQAQFDLIKANIVDTHKQLTTHQ